MTSDSILSGDVLTEEMRFTLEEVCRRCTIEVEEVVLLVEEGIVEPRGERTEEWRFGLRSVRRVHTAVRLQRDLGVNRAGAALAIELLERIEELERRMR